MATNNCLVINQKKTKLICFKNPLKAMVTNEPLLLHARDCASCKCTPIEYVNSIKYLGVFFDSDLSWNDHLAYICGRLRKISWLLFNIRSIAPTNIKVTIMLALAYSILRYGITLFAFCSSRWQCRVDNILKSMLKSIVYNRSSTDNANLFSLLRLPSFQASFNQTVVLRHFWGSQFKKECIAPRILRKTSRFLVPFVKTRYGKAIRKVYVPTVFNDLPDRVFSATTKRSLRNSLKSL